MTSPFRIPVYEPQIGEAERANVLECLDEGWVSSKGKFVERFESTFRDYVGAEYALTTSNGTTALHLAVLALGLGPGDEVVVPTLTYVAAANAITYVGATPVFVDSLKDTWLLDPDDIERVITPRTRAIIAVHLYGLPCDMAAIDAIARKHGLLVVEDCAEAIGSRIHGKHVGTFGDVGTFSFYGNKTITTGEGGMVVTNNPTLAERVFHLKGQGLARHRQYWHDVIGYNYRMTNICAAMGCGQLLRISDILRRKQEVAALYREKLCDRVGFQVTPEQCEHSHWMISVTVSQPRMRDTVRDVLEHSGIETRPVFYPVHSMPMYCRNFRRLLVADSIASCGITLPSHPTLSDADICFISDSVRQAIGAC
jgi:perosamine synthetase